MPVSLKKRNILSIARIVCYLYFLSIAAFWITDNFYAGYTNWYMIVLGILLVLQAILNFKVVDVVFGGVLVLLSFYMLLAVTSDLIDHFNGTKPVKTFAVYFGYGYTIFGIALAAAYGLCYIYYVRNKIQGADGHIAHQQH